MKSIIILYVSANKFIMFPCVNLANGPWEYVFPNITHEKQLKYIIMASIRKFTVCSYNMGGFNSNKINYVTDLLGRYDYCKNTD